MINYKFRKKPVVIEAFQMTAERATDQSDWPAWLVAARQKQPSEIGALFPSAVVEDTIDNFRIQTLEGNQLVSWNDYIIQGVQGEVYPCKPDIFEKTYEPV